MINSSDIASALLFLSFCFGTLINIWQVFSLYLPYHSTLFYIFIFLSLSLCAAFWTFSDLSLSLPVLSSIGWSNLLLVSFYTKSCICEPSRIFKDENVFRQCQIWVKLQLPLCLLLLMILQVKHLALPLPPQVRLFWSVHSMLADLIECLKNYGWRFETLYRRRWSKPSPKKRSAKRQNACLKRPYK